MQRSAPSPSPSKDRRNGLAAPLLVRDPSALTAHAARGGHRQGACCPATCTMRFAPLPVSQEVDGLLTHSGCAWVVQASVTSDYPVPPVGSGTGVASPRVLMQRRLLATALLAVLTAAVALTHFGFASRS